VPNPFGTSCTVQAVDGLRVPSRNNERLREFGVQDRGTDVPDRPVKARGRVRRTSQVEGERIVEIDPWLKDSAGQQTATGSAVVSVP
jgi:hypothetical protein